MLIPKSCIPPKKRITTKVVAVPRGVSGVAIRRIIKTIIAKRERRKIYILTKEAHIEQKVARLLANGHIVARVSGRMEWGARALGNRSILAHPQNTDVIMTINEKMKNRDFWMPFAPSILDYREKDYMINQKHFASPYMMLGFDTSDKAKKEMRACMHQYDFTVRPQIVSKLHSPFYYKLLQEFEKLTGIGGVLNTSFNLHGYPIVCGPNKALKAFENSGLEFLALGSYLIQKRNIN